MMATLEITQRGSPVLPDPDLALVEAAKDGSIAAFEELVKRHERQMFRIAHSLLHNREDAEDAVQGAFLKAFQKLLQFQAKAKFSTWLGRITFNEAFTKLRKEPVRWTTIGHDASDETDSLPREIADWAPDPEMLYRGSELRDILEKNLRRLNPNLRAVFLLHDVEGLVLEDCAESLGITVAAVKTRSWRARLQLREWLHHYFSNEKHPPACSVGPPAPQLRPLTALHSAWSQSVKKAAPGIFRSTGSYEKRDHRESSPKRTRSPGDKDA